MRPCLLLLILVNQALGMRSLQPALSNLKASVGGYVVLNCRLDFPQDIEIPYSLHWNKDGQEIFSWYEGLLNYGDDFLGRIAMIEDAKKKGFGRGSINLTAIRESDSGLYECKVIFPNRTPVSRNNGTWFNLEVDGVNLIRTPPMNMTIMENQETHLPCTTKSSEIFVDWQKDGTSITKIPDLSSRSYKQPNGSLVINPTNMLDMGEYTCKVTDVSTGEEESVRAFLNVTYKAKVIFAPSEVYLPYGRQGMLPCHFSANPPLTNLRWEKDGFLFDPYNVQGVFYRRNGSLLFNKVDESHAGKYACIPQNSLGTEGPSSLINVIVQRPPSFVLTPHNLYLRKIGDTIEFPCDAVDSDFNHRPTIIWTKDGRQLPKERYNQEGGNLTLTDITEADRGFYQCSATNEAATITAETELMVENVPPRAPYNVMATSTKDSVSLKWSPASSEQSFTNPKHWSTYSRPKTEYMIWYKPVEVSEWRAVKLSNSRALEATVSGLSPGRQYDFMVLSQDQYGDGMFSKNVKIWTAGSDDSVHDGNSLESMAQLGPPRDVSVHLTSEGYVITWMPPSHGEDILKIYVIRWWRGKEEKVMGSAETTKTFYILDDLDEDEIYHFQVYAISQNNIQASSSKVSVHVPAYGKIRGAVAAVACVLLLVLAGAIFWFSRHRLKRRPKDDETKSGPE